MDYVLLFLLILTLLLSGVFFNLLQKRVLETSHKIMAVEEELTSIRIAMELKEERHQIAVNENRDNVSMTYESILDTKLSEIAKVHSNKLENKLSDLTSYVEKSLHSYLIQEEKEMEQWIGLVEKEKNASLAIQLLESAMNNFPGSYKLLNEYVNRIRPFLDSSDLSVRRMTIERYNKATRVFLDNCRPEHWSEAKKFNNEALLHGNQFMKVQVSEFEKQAEAIISELEELVNITNLTDAQLEKIETLDSQLQKDLLKNFKELHMRYTKVTQHLFAYLSPDVEQAGIQQYNLRAVKQFKKAHELFIEREAQFKLGNDLNLLSDLLGTWDHTYLAPATQLYFQNVYLEIFAKLRPDVKPKMTQYMLTAEKRKVTA